MTPEVKKRIEQIRQGIVPEGYVKDKDGIYLRDWASKKIGQWLKLAERPIVLQDEEEYQLVTVRRGFGGVDSRGSFLGKNVLVKNYFIVKTGDFIISKRQIAHGACGIVPPELDGAVVSNEYNVFLPQDGTNIQMFNLMMQLPHYKRLFYLMSDGVHIEKLLFKTQDWMKRTLAMPLLKEQKKIAEILSTQDKAIELQACKIEELKRFKKGCLEKMFPRKGQKVPEKRFPGFTDDWEQRKLGDLLQTLPFKQFLKEPEPDGKYEIIQQGNEPVIGFANGTPCGDYKDVVIFGDHTLSLYKPQHPFFVATDGVRIVKGQQDTDGYYLLSLLERYKPQSEGYKRYYSILADTNCITTYNTSEQEKIGVFFKLLDNLITLHQRKLEEMKRQKKALMQTLLTGIVKTKGEVR